jgi:hypothetical protein
MRFAYCALRSDTRREFGGYWIARSSREMTVNGVETEHENVSRVWRKPIDTRLWRWSTGERQQFAWV